MSQFTTAKTFVTKTFLPEISRYTMIVTTILTFHFFLRTILDSITFRRLIFDSSIQFY